MTGEAVRQLGILRKICGEGNWDHVSFVTTKWPEDQVYRERLELGTKESDLRKDYWRPMIRKGSGMYRFEGTKASAETIVRSLMSQPPVTFALQREMTQFGSLAESEAGRFVIEARDEDERRCQQSSSAAQAASPSPSPKRYGTFLTAQELADLVQSIENRKRSENKLAENVQENVRGRIKAEVKKGIKETGKVPSAVSLVSVLIGLGSLAANLVQIFTG
jgi:hypothetical protein